MIQNSARGVNNFKNNKRGNMLNGAMNYHSHNMKLCLAVQHQHILIITSKKQINDNLTWHQRLTRLILPVNPQTGQSRLLLVSVSSVVTMESQSWRATQEVVREDQDTQLAPGTLRPYLNQESFQNVFHV